MSGLGASVGNGTSPRMRGKLVDGEEYHFILRNIPAYAGKTVGA